MIFRTRFALALSDCRHKFVDTLKSLGFIGTLFIPVPRPRFLLGEEFENEVGWTYDRRIVRLNPGSKP